MHVFAANYGGMVCGSVVIAGDTFGKCRTTSTLRRAKAAQCYVYSDKWNKLRIATHFFRITHVIHDVNVTYRTLTLLKRHVGGN